MSSWFKNKLKLFNTKIAVIFHLVWKSYPTNFKWRLYHPPHLSLALFMDEFTGLFASPAFALFNSEYKNVAGGTLFV